MKKILIISLEFPPQVGGIATYVEQFANSLNKEQVVVLAPKRFDAKEYDQKLNFKVIRKNFYWPVFIWPRWTKLFFIIKKIVKQEKIDILYIHHALPVGYLGLLCKKLLKTPYLIFSHGTDIEVGTKRAWKRKMFKMVARGAEAIIFNSNSLQNRFLRILPEFEAKAKVLYPCPEIEFLTKPEETVLNNLRSQYALEGKKVMLTISRLAEGKGLPHLLRVMPEILKQVPNLVWLIIGDGAKKDWLLQEIYKKDLQSVVRYLGSVPHSELKPYYYLADLFVLLTHPDEGREEGLGLVFLEAAACAKPVVAGKSGGVEEGVIDGETGVVVDIYKGDKEMVQTIADLLNDREQLTALGVSAQKRIIERFNWQEQLRVIAEYL